jgi:hexosaminidase
MNNNYALLPAPRRFAELDGNYTIPAEALIFLDVPQPQTILFTAGRFLHALQSQFNYSWQRSASHALPADEVGLTLRIDPREVSHPEGYRLIINSSGILIEASADAGLFYGINTLIQLIIQAGRVLRCVEIEDWPDFAARGIMLDISRDKVPLMKTLLDLVDRLAGWKINQIQLYTEHTFEYRNHKEVWAKASPLSSEDILQLDAYCRQRYIELVPNQNSFGHMERWLKHPRYAPLAEKHGEIKLPWGVGKGPFGLAPVNKGSLVLIKSLYDELLPNFSSKTVNVGCDETFDLGQGQSMDLVNAKGSGRVYLDFLLAVYADVSRRGYRMQFWGDIIVQHPELVPELPRDAIGLLWGYEADHPFDQQCAQFAAAGLPFYVCPGTSTWNTIGGRTENTLANLRSAAEAGLKHGAVGYLNTDWGDNGHWQQLPISYLGFAAGAAYCWCYETNQDVDLPQVLSLFAFDDRSKTMGTILCDLGAIPRQIGVEVFNATPFHRLLQTPLEKIPGQREAKAEILNNALRCIDAAIQPFAQERMARMDADLIRREFLFTARLMRHACYRGFLAIETDPQKITVLSQQMSTDIKEIIDEYRLLWLSRNRPGGLEDSAARMEKMRGEYSARFLARFLENNETNGRS